MLSLDTLYNVKRDFEKWRASRPNKVGRIPNYLWDKVLDILDYYPVGEVTKVLRLSGGQVSAKRKQRDACNLVLSCQQLLILSSSIYLRLYHLIMLLPKYITELK